MVIPRFVIVFQQPTRPERQVIVLIPELVQRRRCHFIVSRRAMQLRAQLQRDGGAKGST